MNIQSIPATTSRAVGALLLLCGASAAQAATTTTTFNVTAQVTSSCSVTAADLDFGDYDPLSLLAVNATTTVSVTCSLLAPYNIGLSAGDHGGSVSTRQMLISGGGTDLLNYGLFRDPTHLLNWGTTVGTDTFAGVGLGIAADTIVYGTIAAGQNVSIGSYSDIITVTVTF